MFKNGINKFIINKNKILKIVPEDALYNKLATSLTKYDYKIGYLIFDFPDLPFKTLYEDSTIIQLKAADNRNKPIIWQDTLSSIKQMHGYIIMTGLKYPF